MPYLKEYDRKLLTPHLDGVMNNSGGLNFAITRLLMEYWKTHEMNYTTLNDILGALEGAKLEFYRRVVVPYEENKKQENGDVY